MPYVLYSRKRGKFYAEGNDYSSKVDNAYLYFTKADAQDARCVIKDCCDDQVLKVRITLDSNQPLDGGKRAKSR